MLSMDPKELSYQEQNDIAPYFVWYLTFKMLLIKKYIGDQEHVAKLDLLMILHVAYPLYSDFW